MDEMMGLVDEMNHWDTIRYVKYIKRHVTLSEYPTTVTYLYGNTFHSFATNAVVGGGSSLFIHHNALGKLGDEAQAEVVVRVRWRVVVAIRHAAVPRIVVPTAATIHSVGAGTLRERPY